MDTGVYLRNNKIRLHYLVISHTHVLCPGPVLPSLGLDFPSQQGDDGCPGKVGQKVMLAHAVQLFLVTSVRHYWARSLSTSSTCLLASLICRIFPHLQYIFSV